MRALKVQLALPVYQLRVNTDTLYPRKKHIMRAERDDLSHTAVKRQRRCRKRRTPHRSGSGRLKRKPEFFRLVNVPAGIYAAAVGGAHQLRCDKIYGELSRLAYYFVRMP